MDRQSSFISKLPIIMTTIEQLKTELSGKKLQLLEAKRVGGDVKELEFEWANLESEIDLLEHTANVMQRGLLGDGVTPDMVLVNGKV
ncbi:hypothetical protein Hanom_Chr10g00929241 [Helianthus anomalus]